MITVLCVLRSGGIYGPEWVTRLQSGVARNLAAPHRFVCLSDMDVPGVEVEPLRHGWPGWWSKIELFRFAGPCLYLDLDCIVTGPLDRMTRKARGLTMCADFLKPGCHNSSAMAWTGDLQHITEAFAADADAIMARYRRTPDRRIGDQAYIEDMAGRVDAFAPSRVVSYRMSAQDGPGSASVVAFHGRPKQHEITTGWVADAW